MADRAVASYAAKASDAADGLRRRAKARLYRSCRPRRKPFCVLRRRAAECRVEAPFRRGNSPMIPGALTTVAYSQRFQGLRRPAFGAETLRCAGLSSAGRLSTCAATTRTSPIGPPVGPGAAAPPTGPARLERARTGRFARPAEPSPRSSALGSSFGGNRLRADPFQAGVNPSAEVHFGETRFRSPPSSEAGSSALVPDAPKPPCSRARACGTCGRRPAPTRR